MYKIKAGGIYMIECGEWYYIGKSVDIFGRWSSHYTALKMNKHHSPLLQEKFNEFGLNCLTFKVLEWVSLTEYKKETGLKGEELKKAFNGLLLKKEKEWMVSHSLNFCLNKDNKHFS